jgi:hypothetical protein
MAGGGMPGYQNEDAANPKHALSASGSEHGWIMCGHFIVMIVYLVFASMIVHTYSGGVHFSTARETLTYVKGNAYPLTYSTAQRSENTTLSTYLGGMLWGQWSIYTVAWLLATWAWMYPSAPTPKRVLHDEAQQIGIGSANFFARFLFYAMAGAWIAKTSGSDSLTGVGMTGVYFAQFAAIAYVAQYMAEVLIGMNGAVMNDKMSNAAEFNTLLKRGFGAMTAMTGLFMATMFGLVTSMYINVAIGINGSTGVSTTQLASIGIIFADVCVQAFLVFVPFCQIGHALYTNVAFDHNEAEGIVGFFYQGKRWVDSGNNFWLCSISVAFAWINVLEYYAATGL